MAMKVTQEEYYAKIPKAVVYHPELTGNDVRVYATLSERAGTRRHSWPGIRRIAEDIGLSPTTVQNAIDKLERLKIIEVERSAGEVNHYHLPLVATVPESDTPPYQELVHPVPESDTELEPLTKTSELEETPNGVSMAELKQVLVEVFGEPPPAHWSLYNRIATWIRDRGGSPDEIRWKAGRIADEWGVKALTVTSLEKHWTRYDAEVGQITDGDVEKYQAELRRQKRALRAQQLGGVT
jgi:hypothetical protein